MSAHEILDLTIGMLTLLVLYRNLVVLRAYAADTKKLASAAVDGLPRPYVCVKTVADRSNLAVLNSTTVSLGDERTLSFQNVGTGRAVNVRYLVRATGDAEQDPVQLPDIGADETFDSKHPIDALPDGSITVIIEYESVAGSSYKTEQIVEERQWITRSIFRRPPSPV